MVDDDLEGALTSLVKCGEDGQEALGGEQEEYRQKEVRGAARSCDNSQTNPSGHQTESTGEESQEVSS